MTLFPSAVWWTYNWTSSRGTPWWRTCHRCPAIKQRALHYIFPLLLILTLLIFPQLDGQIIWPKQCLALLDYRKICWGVSAKCVYMVFQPLTLVTPLLSHLKLYMYIWDIILTCSTYYGVLQLFFVCLRISHYRVLFLLGCWTWNNCPCLSKIHLCTAMFCQA